MKKFPESTVSFTGNTDTYQTNMRKTGFDETGGAFQANAVDPNGMTSDFNKQPSIFSSAETKTA